ncbi:MAG: aminodeoxychorismate/anthranilate synthase component II [Planctomycetes bacterium]|nr:aminodeoxychorismate/anthranilate synthase component II [Planctomycetota bacterium]
MILLLDNYDSFVYNLDRYLQRLGQSTLVVRSDAIQAEAIGRLQPTAIVISPGPKSPNDAGCSVEVIRRYSPNIPILGVCLGHQAIGQAFGATIVRGPAPMHGKASEIAQRDSRLLSALPNRFQVGRYHSLVIDPETLPSELLATAWSDDGGIMAVEHRDFPVFGVQFHPESILTHYGYEILASFLRLGGHTPGPTPQPDWTHPSATIPPE